MGGMGPQAVAPETLIENVVNSIRFNGPLGKQWYCFQVVRLQPSLLKLGPSLGTPFRESPAIAAHEMAVTLHKASRHGQHLQIAMEPVENGATFLWHPSCPAVDIAALSKSLGVCTAEHCQVRSLDLLWCS